MRVNVTPYTSVGIDENPVLGKLDLYMLTNAVINYRSLFVEELNFGIGVHV